MSKNYFLIASVIIILMFFSCEKREEKRESILGLWAVEKVEVGEEIMTPVARWMQFNSDSTQTSGNGWLKHSYGTWSLNANKELRIINKNGLLDEAASFQIDIKNEKMIWKRNEEGQNVQVFLKRVDEKPASPGNKMMGLWKLETYVDSDTDVTSKVNPNNNQTLYLSWDNVFREHNLIKGRRVGIYKIHGHRPEIQMVNYGDTPKFSFWRFLLKNDKLVLTSRDNKIVKTYHRIYKFLQ